MVYLNTEHVVGELGVMLAYINWFLTLYKQYMIYMYSVPCPMSNLIYLNATVNVTAGGNEWVSGPIA